MSLVNRIKYAAAVATTVLLIAVVITLSLAVPVAALVYIFS